MKHLCCNKILTLFFLLITTLYGALNDKSAIVYLGEKISYPMVGLHDYIIVDPKKTNTYTHGFKVYNKKIYARVVINKNFAPNNLLSNLEQLSKQGFKNFFFDVEQVNSQKNLNIFLSKFRLKNNFTNAKAKIKRYKNLRDDIIDVETTSSLKLSEVTNLGVISCITSASMQGYGKSSKNAVKREILTLIDESTTDRMESSAHQYGAIPLEYQGYIQTIHNIHDGLPDPDEMAQYAGVVIWLTVDYTNPAELISWAKKVTKKHIPVVFARSFGFNLTGMLLKQLGIETYDGAAETSKKIVLKDPMMDYEINTPINHGTFYYQAPKGSKKLVAFEDTEGLTSTTAAITPWGGYAIGDSFMTEVNKENIWVINPFKFFKEALRLKDLAVPDSTTENGSRLFFAHIDGDGIMNGVEFDPELVSGDIIYKEILKKYPFPHSVSVIGAEIMPNGLYPEQSQRLLKITSEMYALENVEPATHTFTHPFYWGEIKNGDLVKEYRLQPAGYKFSLDYELSGMLNYINENLLEQNSTKKAQTVYWSGDCIPKINTLEYTYKHHILNINGGDTTINNSSPWLTLVTPYDLQRGENYQIYTGAQNENVFTNDWLGTFWGFKKFVQTFQLTDSPRRLKPIDVYYHLYSGSKKASLNALRYVFDWVMAQKNIMPLFTAEYIPKMMDYYTISIAEENGTWLYAGMDAIKTLRLEHKNFGVDLQNDTTVLGVQHFEKHPYISLDQHAQHIAKPMKQQASDNAYLISANGKIEEFINNSDSKRYRFSGHIPLELSSYVPKKLYTSRNSKNCSECFKRRNG
ncbi:MAG: hypothetical protein IE887_02050 [Campylobacterales bacterium]|nr:hypothetical protein [Campylobacterales bacterium]